jgi:uncharacterized protein (TIGR00106 family)
LKIVFLAKNLISKKQVRMNSRNMIIAQLSIVPIGKGTSLSKYVKQVIKTLEKENIRFETNAMATVIETENVEKLFNIVQKAHNTMITMGAERVITELKIDDRRDKEATIESKLESIK